MIKFGIKIERINKIQSPLFFEFIFQSPFMSRTVIKVNRQMVLSSHKNNIPKVSPITIFAF